MMVFAVMVVAAMGLVVEKEIVEQVSMAAEDQMPKDH